MKKKDEDIQIRMAQLTADIEQWDFEYYILNDPTVSDAVYDASYRELKELEKKYPQFVDPASPTQRVSGQRLESFAPYQHITPMLSLENAMDNAALLDWVALAQKHVGKRDYYIVEPKIDGLSIEVLYIDGVLAKAGTRGDGNVGEDITAQARTIRNLPLRLRGTDIPHRVRVRGEAYIEKAQLAAINVEREANGEKPFANCRNAAAGSLRNLDPAVTARRGLKVLFYSMEEPIEINDEHLFTDKSCLDIMVHLGLPVIPSVFIYDNWVRMFHQFEAGRKSYPFDIDGLVFKVNNLSQRAKMGATSHHPRWAIAAKFEAETVTTKLKYVTHQVGRTGKITPVAELHPVEVGGVTVTRATLHNEDQVNRLGIKLPCMVEIRRAGEVIPEVVRVVKTSKLAAPYVFPTTCPECNMPLTRKEGEANHYCTNTNCPEQLIYRIVHFASRDAMDIDGLGEETVRQLVDLAMVQTLPDIYRLTPERLMKLPRFATKSARKLYDSIQATLTPTLDRFIYALGIPGVGKSTAKDLAAAFETFDNLWEANVDQLEAIENIGSTTAESIVAFLNTPANEAMINGLLDVGVSPLRFTRQMEAKANSFWAGKQVVITGTFPIPRPELQKRLEALGAKVTGSVSSKTDYLVCGEKPGSKVGKAEALNIGILTDNDKVVKEILK